MRSWSASDRSPALARAEREGVDLLVIGGGIAGAGVLRDAATRGMRALLVERSDFASGTSSRSSKMIHGGFRYIAEGQLRVTRESCRERDRLLRQDPHLVRPLPFLLPSYEDSRLPFWKIRAGLAIYSALANFRRSARHRMLDLEEISTYSRDLRLDGLRGAGLYVDGQVDDVRLVLESLKGARDRGCEAVNHAEVVDLARASGGRVERVLVRDRVNDRDHWISASVVVNATGPGAERIRALDRSGAPSPIRPAKGVHLVIARDRIHLAGAVAFEAPDGRMVFLSPWEDVVLIGTTDSFDDEIDEPVVRIEEVHYLLAAANAVFPQAGLTTNDLRCVFAGVRPLSGGEDEDSPSGSVSREDRILEDSSGLLSATGGKLTTYRAVGERIVDRAVRLLEPSRRRELRPSASASTPLRNDGCDPEELEATLCARFELSPEYVQPLVRRHGAEAESLLSEAPRELHQPIGDSRFLFAEIPRCIQAESPLDLCDLLERRMRLVICGEGQGLPQLPRIAGIVAEHAGWDAAKRDEEIARYTDAVRRHYQIRAPESAEQQAATAA